MKRNKKGQFIKNTTGTTFEGFGVWYDKKGYPTIWINNKNIKVHVYVWEKINGEKPKGFDIHHKDFNKGNYDINNLELLSYSDHQKIHAGWARECGVWTSKPCKNCKQLLPLNEFYPRKGLTPSNHCKKCSCILAKEKLSHDPKGREQKRLYLKGYYKTNKTDILNKQRETRVRKHPKVKDL